MVQINFIVWPEKENEKLAQSLTHLLCCYSLSYSSSTYFNSFLPTAIQSGYKWHFSSRFQNMMNSTYCRSLTEIFPEEEKRYMVT